MSDYTIKMVVILNILQMITFYIILFFGLSSIHHKPDIDQKPEWVIIRHDQAYADMGTVLHLNLAHPNGTFWTIRADYQGGFIVEKKEEK